MMLVKMRKNNTDIDAQYFVESCYDMKSISDNSGYLAFCLQTLAWINQPDLCIKEMVRIIKPGGHIFITSLFNLDYDCDLIVKVRDYTKDKDSSIN